ncbi:DEAD/DEAH box helicase family protein [Streptomyces justiciae]|uniref:DEAD/DEAH box helicase family protein n=1 Tax=Streptomyces justiciae TaxID=2780140 RepID=UPI002117612A|nr:DEAD/DEAH box helicase family protein [Streptomyces justiciae]MCW8384097.1 DEAD/DEAH box helicase family protein [Streptomyces justiciae]
MSTSGAQANDDRNVNVRAEQTLREAGWRVCTLQERDLKPDATAVRIPHPELNGAFLYLLYTDRDLCGLVVAGSETADPHELLADANHLAASLAEQHQRHTWQARALPFRYGTNGHVWRFLNALDAEHLNGTPAADAPQGGARSRYVFAPARPTTVTRWKRQAVQRPEAPSLRARLRRLPEVHLDPQRQLYDAQRRAIEGLESSLAANRQRALIQMATGAGKTYTVVQASHRLLRNAGAHRVLFLVDRFNLGDQAYQEYRDFQPADSKKPLHEEYPLKHLSGPRSGLADSDKIVITTIQRLWCMLTNRTPPEPGSEEAKNYEGGGRAGLGKALPEVRYSPILPPDSFDFIVIDECHRSIYGAWRPVLEYFDAHVVGLTATPIGPTFAFFENNLVSQYTYEEAVADEVNVDYDVYRISTRITRDGSKIPAVTETQAPDGTIEKINTVVAQVDRVTRKQHWHQQEDDDEYTAAELNARVESTSQIRTVIETFRDRLFTEIFPPEADPDTGAILHQRSVVPKTLIFAATNRHADTIVAEVKRAWDAGDRFCLKINSETANPSRAIKDFRNESEIRIAVTVDMIATGTDIPALECLVFMRDVRTWSYFEQMKGRGARIIKPEDLRRVTEDAVCKDRFVIVDTVGVTEHAMVDARPLVQDDLRELPSLERLLRACAEGAVLSVADVSTLAGRLSRLGQRLDEQQLVRIEGCTGGRKLTELVTDLVHAADPDRLARVRGADKVGDSAGQTGDGSAGTDQASPAADGAAEASTDAVLEQALRPFIEREALREALLDAARSRLITIDHISRDGDVIAEGVTDVMRAERTVQDWRRFMAERQDKFAALRIAFEERRPLSVVQAQIDEVLGLVSPPQQRWTGQELWKAYVDLGIARTRRRRNAGLPELLSVLRCELKLDDGQFRPYRDTVGLRLREWLARQETAGVKFTEEQRGWLGRVANVVATSAAVSADALDQHAVCRAEGGWSRFRTVFSGEVRTPGELIDELDRELGA